MRTRQRTATATGTTKAGSENGCCAVGGQQRRPRTHVRPSRVAGHCTECWEADPVEDHSVLHPGAHGPCHGEPRTGHWQTRSRARGQAHLSARHIIPQPKATTNENDHSREPHTASCAPRTNLSTAAMSMLRCAMGIFISVHESRSK